MYNYNNEDDNRKEKIPMKDLFAIMLAQYSILLPIAIGACVVFILIALFIVKVMMGA